MGFQLKPQAVFVLITVLMGGLVMACSGPEPVSDAKAPQSAAMDHSDMGHDAKGHAMATLPIEHRLAFMSGHVAAGLALYRAGEPEMGAPHLLHPVSETHQAERAGLEALGFTPEVFKTVSAALDAGRPASEIEPQLMAAEEHLRAMAAKAEGNPIGIIHFLMDTIVEEYAIAITDGSVSDPGEYQDAYGFAIVAKHHAKTLGNEALIQEIDELIALWPKAPITPENPTTVAEVVAKTSSVRDALPTTE